MWGTEKRNLKCLRPKIGLIREKAAGALTLATSVGLPGPPTVVIVLHDVRVVALVIIPDLGPCARVLKIVRTKKNKLGQQVH